MKKLHISPGLDLPIRFLELRTVIYGGSGSGKTTAGRVLFEEATNAGVLAGAIDLKSDWWGLKSTADGKNEGIPIVVFGGDHADVPIEPEGGAALAEIIVDLQQPFVIDLENFSKAKQMRFLAAFFERLYDVNRTPMVLFCDEADRYSPQKPMTPEANFCLGAVEDIAKRGRKHGIFPVFITQRNASLNKNVSELCDVAIVFRTPGPRDQEAVEEWFSTKATKEQRDLVMKNLAGLDTGSAVICSAHPNIRLFEQAKMRLPTTFDSSATPTIGGRRILAPKKLATPDLERIREKMAETIERSANDDPKKLRQTIADLKRQLEAKGTEAKAIGYKTQTITKEVPVLKDSHLERLEKVANDIIMAANKVRNVQRIAMKAPEIVIPIQDIRMNKAPGVTTAPTYEKTLSTGEKKILSAVIQYQGGRLKRQIAILTGYAVNGGAFNNYLSALRSNGYVVGKEKIEITQAGIAALGTWEPLPTGSALRDHWLRQLGQAEKAVLQALINDYPDTATKEHIANMTAAYKPDHKPYAANGGGFNNAISRLRTLELIEGGKDSLKAADILFDE